MKLVFIGIISALVFVPAAASAQAPVANWNALTGTVSIGGAWGNSTQRDNGVNGNGENGSGDNVCEREPRTPGCPGNGVGDTRADGDYKASGFALGLGFGYNWQFASFVIGAEADISKTWVNGRSSVCGIGMPVHDCGTKMDALATFRGKLGYAFDRYLAYVTGGGAAAEVSAYDKLFNVSGKQTMWGVSYGAGLEAMLANSFSMKVEYLRADFKEKAVFDIVPGTPERIGLHANIVRAGITYHFSGLAPLR